MSYMSLQHVRHLFQFFPPKVTKNNISSTSGPDYLTSLVCYVAKSRPPQGCLVSCLCKTQGAWFTSRTISFANNTYLKITLDKIEPAMFAVWFYRTLLQRSCGIIETWNLPEKILLFKALKDYITLLRFDKLMVIMLHLSLYVQESWELICDSLCLTCLVLNSEAGSRILIYAFWQCAEDCYCLLGFRPQRHTKWFPTRAPPCGIPGSDVQPAPKTGFTRLSCSRWASSEVRLWKERG